MGSWLSRLQNELIQTQALGGLSTVDNQFATVQYDEGWIGIAAILVLVVYILRRRSEESAPYVVGALMLVVCFFSFDVLYIYGTCALIGIYVGAIYRTRRLA